MTRSATRVLSLLATAATATLLLSGCGLDIPADPDGTLDRVSGGVLRVGVSAHEPWTSPVDQGDPTGVEVDLVSDFAATIDADVQWSAGGEESLVHRLERGELDLVIGGLTAQSPWTAQVVLTKPYVTVSGPDGEPEDHVMAAPMGENAFLVELETFLLSQEVRP